MDFIRDFLDNALIYKPTREKGKSLKRLGDAVAKRWTRDKRMKPKDEWEEIQKLVYRSREICHEERRELSTPFPVFDNWHIEWRAAEEGKREVIVLTLSWNTTRFVKEEILKELSHKRLFIYDVHRLKLRRF